MEDMAELGSSKDAMPSQGLLSGQGAPAPATVRLVASRPTSSSSASSFKHHHPACVPVSVMPDNLLSVLTIPARRFLLPESSLVQASEAFRCLSIDEEPGSGLIPAAYGRKVRSETSLCTMKRHGFNDGISLVSKKNDKPDAPGRKDSIFVESRDVDDVFHDNIQLIKSSQESSTPAHDNPVNKIDNDVKIPEVKSQITPRADRIGSPITPANAQGILPPEACIFVANLSMARSDDQLEQSCHQAFDIFGKNVIKVRRDRHKHPFALVQYYTVGDADQAMVHANNSLVDGRRIRTEKAEARRSALLTRRDGVPPTSEETMALLSKYGPIRSLRSMTQADFTKYHVNSGMLVDFAFYDDFKDALKAFLSTPESDLYHLEEPREIESGRPSRSFTDLHSIFVGNLPEDITEQEIRDLFSAYGSIEVVNIIRKRIEGGYGMGFNIFSFVEYTTKIAAENATCDSEHDGKYIRGQKLRVERKEYSLRRGSRLGNRHIRPGNFYRGWRSPQANHFHHAAMTPPHHDWYGNYAMAQGFNPYQHYQPSDYHNALYTTPPPTNRITRRNEMTYSGSPHGMPVFSPLDLSHAQQGYSLDSMIEDGYDDDRRNY